MKTSRAFKHIALTIATTWATGVVAHDGHALTGAHWHSSDAWGFVVLGMVAAGIWLSRRDK